MNDLMSNMVLRDASASKNKDKNKNMQLILEIQSKGWQHRGLDLQGGVQRPAKQTISASNKTNNNSCETNIGPDNDQANHFDNNQNNNNNNNNDNDNRGIISLIETSLPMWRCPRLSGSEMVCKRVWSEEPSDQLWQRGSEDDDHQ